MSELIFAFGQYFAGKLHPASLEILTPLRQIADSLRKRLILICLVDSREDFLKVPELKNLLTDEVWYVVHDKFRFLLDDLAGRVLTYLANTHKPYGFFFPATKAGLSLAPRVAGSLKVGLCAHVNAFEIEGGNLILIRPTYGENIIAKLTTKTYPIMATIALNAFPIKESSTPPGLTEISLPDDFPWETSLRVKAFKGAKIEPSRLAVAKVVVAGGMGLKTRENFELLYELASLLGGEVGATRPAVHAGWAKPEEMIGVSGITVRPKLYLAFGISGAIQHTAGMENSEFVVAINTDREAPLMKMSNVGLVSDAPSLLKTLLKKIRT